mmetsp:Transcript_9303/g.24609  ORF Transcript_9303/g.24609 Transcript_9303/m.24609 type:complete len:556 (-) Transcript_9303:692-2359(-)
MMALTKFVNPSQTLREIGSFLAQSQPQARHLPSRRALLLFGESGSGKTTLAGFVASSAAHQVFRVDLLRVAQLQREAASAGVALLQSAFDAAREAAALLPSAVVLDDLELIMPDEELRSALSFELATLHSPSLAPDEAVFVIATVRAAEAKLVHPLSRSPLQFDTAVAVHYPSHSDRLEIAACVLELLGAKRAGLHDAVRAVADRTAGYVAADFAKLVVESQLIARSRTPECVLDSSVVSGAVLGDVLRAIQLRVAPAAIATCRWWRALDDRGAEQICGVRLRGLDEQERTLALYLGAAVDARHRAALRKLGVRASRGLLVHGESGCGKTALCMKVGSEMRAIGANFVAVHSAELISSLVGETERALTQLFSYARAAAPTIVLVENIEVLAPRRSESDAQDASTGAQRLLGTLLTLLDGVEIAEHDDENQVVMLATTGRKDAVDPALLRPGRIEIDVEVCRPELLAREQIVSDELARLSSCPSDYVDTTDSNERNLLARQVAQMSMGFTPPQIRAVCQAALSLAIASENAHDRISIEKKHLLDALVSVRQSSVAQ